MPEVFCCIYAAAESEDLLPGFEGLEPLEWPLPELSPEPLPGFSGGVPCSLPEPPFPFEEVVAFAVTFSPVEAVPSEYSLPFTYS